MPYVVIRHYSGSNAPKLIDELASRPDTVREVIAGIPGFVGYHLVRTESGGFSVSVFEDRAGADESVSAARNWIKENLPDLSVAPPEVIQGEAVFSF